MILSTSNARGQTVCVFSLIVEKPADGILGVKRGVAAVVIQFLE